MKQFYYTSCRAGESVSGQSGFQIRATSEPLTPEEENVCYRCLGYKISVSPEVPKESLPVKLLFWKHTQRGSLALRSTWLGEDPVTRRQGNYFAHVLLNLPENVTAREVLGLWGSRFWKTENDATISGTELEVPKTFPAGTLGGEGWEKELLDHPRRWAIFAFLVEALWHRTPRSKILVAAEPEDLVWGLWGVVQWLPMAFWEDLTFSTYEKDPLLAPPLVVGVWSVDNREELLRREEFQPPYFGFNTFTGEKSTFPSRCEYLKFFFHHLQLGQGGSLVHFQETLPEEAWQKLAWVEGFYQTFHHPDTADLAKLAEAEIPQWETMVFEDPRRTQRLMDNLFSHDAMAAARKWRNVEGGKSLTEATLAWMRKKIVAEDTEALEHFWNVWFSRKTEWGLEPSEIWPLFHPQEGASPQAYRWIFPKVLRQTLDLSDTKEAEEWLMLWIFRDTLEYAGKQLHTVMRQPFPESLKEAVFFRFYEQYGDMPEVSGSKIWPMYPDATYALMEYLMHRGQPEKAKELFQKLSLAACAPTLFGKLIRGWKEKKSPFSHVQIQEWLVPIFQALWKRPKTTGKPFSLPGNPEDWPILRQIYPQFSGQTQTKLAEIITKNSSPQEIDQNRILKFLTEKIRPKRSWWQRLFPWFSRKKEKKP
ncbi:MAG: hypothetical protein Q4D62_02835 [Planctomycetia bacterium]|nr:hypothetical protein [Planctomycetia bacterium]